MAYGQTEAPSILLIIGNVIRVAIGLVGIIFVILAIYAGFLWMTAAGSDEKVDKAKKTLTNAVIGIVLVVAAYAIASFVLQTAIFGPIIVGQPQWGTPTPACTTPPC